MIPLDNIKGLLTEDIVNLFGDSVLDKSFESAWKLVNRLITDTNVYQALADSEALEERFRTVLRMGTIINPGWNSSDFLRNRRILFVNRQIDDSSPVVRIQATKIEGNLATTKASLSSSLYYENDQYNPKYYHGYGGQIKILPDSVDLEVFFHTFPRFGLANQYNNTHRLEHLNFSKTTGVFEDNLFFGIPYNARQLVYIQMALNMLQYYLSDAIHEEEDRELTELIASQVVSLDKEKKEHLQFVVANYGNDNFGDAE